MKKLIEPRFGKRIRQLREASGASQDTLAGVLGLKDRQSVSQIEAGKRRISANELLAAAYFFKVSMEDLSNPFLLATERASFSWRQSGVSTGDLAGFELRAGEWIGAFRELSHLNGERLRTIMPRLALTHTSTFEEAVAAGEAVSKEMQLGSTPAHKLAETMESELGILVLMVDAIRGISGAACRLPELNAVLINRNESEARRNFDLAHELFHIMTWDKMPPARVEMVGSTDGQAEQTSGVRTQAQKRLDRVEVLANNFASGLLMPKCALDALGAPRGDSSVWLLAAAAKLGVSGQALKYRMLNCGRLDGKATIGDFEITSASRRGTDAPVPLLFSKSFIGTIAAAIEGGHLSGRRAAALLDMSTDALGDLCDSYLLARPVEL